MDKKDLGAQHNSIPVQQHNGMMAVVRQTVYGLNSSAFLWLVGQGILKNLQLRLSDELDAGVDEKNLGLQHNSMTARY